MQYSCLVAFVLAMAAVNQVLTYVEFTNVKCEMFNDSYAFCEKCFLKSVNRTYKYLSLYVRLLQNPIDNVTLRVKIWKRANGYRPFLYDITFDACKFLRYNNNKVLEYFHSFFKEYSNMNHTCPYSDAIIVHQLPIHHINNLVTNVLPVPHGDYLFDSTWSTYNVKRATFKLYVTVK